MVARRRAAKKEPDRTRGAGGRPTSYDPKYARAAKKLCELGATDADLAAAFGVTTATVWNWRNRHAEFFGALKDGKDAYDTLVVRSLASRAVGYTYDAEEIKTINGQIHRVPVRKHVPPDTTACIFWLKNRLPEEWRDVQRQEGRVEHPVTVTIDESTAKALAAGEQESLLELLKRIGAGGAGMEALAGRNRSADPSRYAATLTPGSETEGRA